ncbi:hypothetical protein [Sinisalibacter aestuarii]|uniref:hypothetical protein n=1 Tax=Sinisalibacter aestuarii TaxID=2949426 RepID=UPI00248FF5FF|nr:hypothetical protein [Sinisalibacter aestuarii]
MEGILTLIFGLLIFAGMLWLYIFLPADMAARRNRSAFVWVLISLVGSPLLAILLLIALGASPDPGSD